MSIMENELITPYLSQLKKYPLLSADEEKKLANSIENGDMRARNLLVQSNLRLVISIAKKYLHYKVSLSDLLQEGNIGLLIAATKFRSSFNTRFSTYAYLWIQQYMLRFIRNKNPAIQIPHRKEAEIRRIRASQDHLHQHLGRKPNVGELSLYLDLSEKEIKNILDHEFSLKSLDSIVDITSETTFGQFLTADTPSPEEDFLVTEKREIVLNIMQELPKKERDVIASRYNLAHVESKNTLRFVGAKLGLSTETVRQIERRALRKIRSKALERGFALS